MASVKGNDYSYYASKSELLSWVNSLLQLQLTRLEQVRRGEDCGTDRALGPARPRARSGRRCWAPRLPHA
jgi:hypothetical protein